MVIVFGSINMDLVTRTSRLPNPGETLLGSNFFTTPGGKGANQAVALSRLGITTQMVGRVGADAFGQELLASLREAGTQTEHVLVDPENHTGVAVITVSDGANQIVGVLGANGEVDKTDVERLKPLLANASALVMQFEIPVTTVKAAAKAAKNAGVRVILDPAPVQTTDLDDLYPLVDIVLPNEVEASQLVGFTVNTPASAAKAAATLRQKGVAIAIIKLGAQGVFCASTTDTFFLPAFPVNAIDTVAAGDAFAGGFIAALVEGQSLRQAVTWGAATGALATTKQGAQTAMCDRATLIAFLSERGLQDPL